jgi:acetoin:2,6-dichlorophenolindophenol oxidoreductase subunit alpha
MRLRQSTKPDRERAIDTMPDDVGHLRAMMLIRGFENSIQTLFSQGLVRGTTHLANGQEAVAVGAAAGLQPQDFVLCTYRGHHHSLAKGLDLSSAFAEVLGRTDGCCGGKGGSMHLTDVSNGLLGSYAVVGSHLPIAVGVAWASRIRGDDSVTACFFGDGTTTIGSFHESLNLAAVWQLPIVFVCENNLYSEYTPIADVVPVEHPAADRASAYGLERIVVDGNDLYSVRDAVGAARGRAAAGNGPSIVEALTYRQGGHSRADPAKYRPADEVAHWMARDPISLFVERIGISAADLEALQHNVDREIQEAVNRALDSPFPSEQALMSNVWGGPVA